MTKTALKGSTYTLIALGVLAGPLAFSFESRVRFWTHWPAVALAALVVGVPFLVWDALVVRKGHWRFNPEWTGRFRLFGLPLGEYLFFFTVPYAMVFSYEAFRTLWSDRVLFVPAAPALFGFAALFFAAALFWRRQGYTALALSAAGLYCALTEVLVPGLAGTLGFWVYLAFGFVAFVVVNGVYTALPTIHYAPRAVWGLRAGTIPLEDFFYNLSFLGLLLDVYRVL
jgi:lycopene cyclase domain-containing protein